MLDDQPRGGERRYLPCLVHDLPASRTVLHERLQREGPRSLSDLELLTLVIGRDLRRSAVLARRLLAVGTLADLSLVPAAELATWERLGPSQAASIVACFELARRVYRSEAGAAALAEPDQVHAVTRDLELARREYFVALFLDARNRVLARETISIGSLNASIVHPREVFRGAVARGAASVILVHNHPSGNPEPSPEDLALTRRLVDAGSLIGIQVLDHLVIGRGAYVSLKSRGFM